MISQTMPYQAGSGAPNLSFIGTTADPNYKPNAYGPYQQMPGMGITSSPYGNPGGYGAPSSMMGDGTRSTGFQTPGAGGYTQNPSTGLWSGPGIPGVNTQGGGGPQQSTSGGVGGVTSGMSYPGPSPVSSGVSSPYGQPYGQPGMGTGGAAPGSNGSGLNPGMFAPGAQGQIGGGSTPPLNTGSGQSGYSGQGMPPAPTGTGGGVLPPGWTPPMGDMGGATMPGMQGASQPPTGQGGWAGYSATAGQTNPYLQNQINGLQTQYNNNLTRNVLPSIQSGAAAVGGIGGARQGIAQGLAIGDSQAGFANAAANLMGQDYENSQNRAMQAYGIDQGNSLGYAGLNNQYGIAQMGNNTSRYGIDQNTGLGYFNGQNNYNLGQQQNQNQANQISNNYNLGNQGQQLDFFNQQGSQDIQRYLANLQGFQVGSNSPWNPLTQFGQVTSPYTGNGTTTQSGQTGGGISGALGGGLGMAQFGHSMGWW